MEDKTVTKEEILLPIDIHYNKLLDWLINRRHCKQEWQSCILEVREKINAAIQDMPAVDEITQLIKGSHINYFHCRRIVELLKETESGTKNIFGRYSSQRMKDWQEIMALYEKDDLYLAEAAQLLARNVNYEVPVLKKQIAKCQQTQKDCLKKETDYNSTAADYRERYSTTCKQMGIEGKKIKSELNELVADLPNVYAKMAADCKSLQKAAEFYTAFVAFTNGTVEPDTDVLRTLRHVQTHGNTTTYEYEKGRPPTSVVEEPVCAEPPDEEAVGADDLIDWGDVTYDPADTSVDIDYDLGDITIEDGGIEMEGSGDVDHDAGVGINFGDDEIVVKAQTHREKGGKDPAKDDGVARGRLAMTVLDNTETRNAFLDDLIELEAFLCQRQAESRSSNDILATCQFDSAPDVMHVDDASLAAMLDHVQTMLGCLTSVRMQHLILIRNAPRYVERLEEKLKQTLAVSEKMLFYQKQTLDRRIEAAKEAERLRPSVNVLVKQTRVLQKQVEEEISKRYKNRHVNIMGEINTM